MSRVPVGQILVGDARALLATLPADSIDCVITSPPYFQLRNYHAEGQIGLEAGVEQWVDELALVMAGVARVLKPTGSLWLNLGDSYSRHPATGAPPKSLLLAPERLALRLIRDGWIIRNKVIWTKTNPMPASVRDRLATTWEVIYFAARNRSYFFDLDAIRTPHRSQPPQPRHDVSVVKGRSDWAGPLAGDNSGLARTKATGRSGHPLGKNPGDVWAHATANYRDAHFATYPSRLIERPLLASCPERVCTSCGQPWRRDRHRMVGQIAVRGEIRPNCCCSAEHRPGIVLDPFMGAGTTALAAETHGREWIGIEINPDYVSLANDRLANARAVRAAA